MIPHSLGGVAALPTFVGSEVLAQAELLAGQTEALYRAHPSIPSPWVLIRDAGTSNLDRPGMRYAYEDRRDDYVLPGQGIIVPFAAWEEFRHETIRKWAEVIARYSTQWTGPFVELIDCEDAAGRAVGYSRAISLWQAWVVILEWLWPWGRPRGWHAEAIIEVPEGVRLAGEVEPHNGRYYTNAPRVARPGYRLAWVDLAWLAGMPKSAPTPAITTSGAELQLEQLELARVIKQVGWIGDAAQTALAIVLAESGGQSAAKSPTGRYRGPWQIDVTQHELTPQQAHDLYYSTAYAYHKLWKQQGFRPWSTFKSGRYLRFMNQAAALLKG